jgi:hypothetical protein
MTRRAIPPEWKVNLLALGKELWRLKYLEDQLNMYRQQWQADQHNRIIKKMAAKMLGKSNDGKLRHSERNTHNNDGGRSDVHQGNNGQWGRERGRGSCCRRGNSNNSNIDHLNTIECYNCGKNVTIPLIARIKEERKWKFQHGGQSRFQKPVSILIEGNVDQEWKSEQEK